MALCAARPAARGVLQLTLLLRGSRRRGGGERRIIAEIKEGVVARRILAHLGLPTSAPRASKGGQPATRGDSTGLNSTSSGAWSLNPSLRSLSRYFAEIGFSRFEAKMWS